MKNEWMEQALSEAKKAAEAGEVPVGAVLVKDGVVIARNHKTRKCYQKHCEH